MKVAAAVAIIKSVSSSSVQPLCVERDISPTFGGREIKAAATTDRTKGGRPRVRLISPPSLLTPIRHFLSALSRTFSGRRAATPFTVVQLRTSGKARLGNKLDCPLPPSLLRLSLPLAIAQKANEPTRHGRPV